MQNKLVQLEPKNDQSNFRQLFPVLKTGRYKVAINSGSVLNLFAQNLSSKKNCLLLFVL